MSPSAVFDLDTGDEISSWPGVVTLGGSSKPSVYFDFGIEVGGIVTVEYEVLSTSGNGTISLAFTEAKNWVGPNSDSSTGIYTRLEGSLSSNFASTGNYTYVMPDDNLRGGFRYMTAFLGDDTASVKITKVSLELSFQPTWSNLRAYQGYFHSNDDLLNKIWYSGAYTLQVTALHPATGRVWPAPDKAWSNSALLGPGNTINTDGAKRDRTVWPGDMGVAIPASFYSTGDVESIRNSLQSLYEYQSSDGVLPYSGAPLLAGQSMSYHMWTMIGMYDYALYSGDIEFIQDNWVGYLEGMSFLAGQFNSSLFLLDTTGYSDDWGRLYTNSTFASAQMLYYRTLITGAALADWVGDESGVNATWLEAAATLQESINAKYWDTDFGAFKDNIGSDDIGLHPQDANSLAVLLGVINATSGQAQDVSSYLTQNWTPIGAEAPELPGEICPFPSSFEIQAHLLAGQTQRALDLIRTSWGWYLNNENGTQSTIIEGYLVNGTFGYRWDAGYANDFSYTSHAHGWGTGPVTALTEHVLGLSVTGRAGSTWQIAPQFGDLKSVEGGFTTNLGKFSASWTVSDDGSYTLYYDVPVGTVGVLLLPVSGSSNTSHVSVNSQAADKTALKVVEGGGGRQMYAFQGEGGQYHVEVS